MPEKAVEARKKSLELIQKELKMKKANHRKNSCFTLLQR
jgi:hypothetical protein